MWKEFKEFIAQGSVMDAAIGFVLGLAFKAIIDSVVNGLLLPVIGYLTAGVDFANLKVVLKAATDTTEEIAITYGQVIQAVISFLLIAFFLFLIVKGLNNMRKKREARMLAEAGTVEEEAAETELALLQEIRDLMKAEQESK
ncbi:MAG: large conductance mechanosensitive channel protein MscL [Eubacteriales bacterium]|nr:large conductance mechanosensitive channel protein MscL [Eubacteriales bacterium]MDD4324429.1 large conductance mechanosensitive channel protein MscL [Eubacteriales bacterium]MDD4541251.1 large conductance mechanosensitive channel protein MscL [Eubacteriales bacterium]